MITQDDIDAFADDKEEIVLQYESRTNAFKEFVRALSPAEFRITNFMGIMEKTFNAGWLARKTVDYMAIYGMEETDEQKYIHDMEEFLHNNITISCFGAEEPYLNSRWVEDTALDDPTGTIMALIKRKDSKK